MSTEPVPIRDRKVGEIAANVVGATSLFRRHKIDFYCGGSVSLTEAASRRGLDPDALEAELCELPAKPRAAPLENAALVAHILSRFHETHRRELPELARLARRVEAVHRDHPTVPRGLADLLDVATRKLTDHMKKEEQVLFPAIRAAYLRSLDMPILVMRHEHREHAQIVHDLEEITGGFTAPGDACGSWQSLYGGVAKFVADLTEHIHLENNVLFPRFEGRQS
jgi:regulator of cell morphogenesis and NO signaling